MLVKTDCDDIIWRKFEPGVFSENALYLCVCYVLPTGTSREVIVETSVFDRVSNDIAYFQSNNNESDCSFIICGDMNARTKDLPDMVSDDNFVHLPLPDDYILDDFIMPRASEDKKSNQNGTLLLEFCKQTNTYSDGIISALSSDPHTPPFNRNSTRLTFQKENTFMLFYNPFLFLFRLANLNHRRSTTGLIFFFFFFFFFFFAFSPVWRPLRYVHAIILPLKPFLSILNQPSPMGYYIDKVGNAVS